jgi:hypothetical protein
MFDDTRIFRRSNPDFPTTKAAQQRLITAGRVEGENKTPYRAMARPPQGRRPSAARSARPCRGQPGAGRDRVIPNSKRERAPDEHQIRPPTVGRHGRTP